MPYINEDRRHHYSELDETIDSYDIKSPGELNYLITLLCLNYLSSSAPNSYSEYNDVIGALESAKLEFYRRRVVDYEQEKIKENGDVY